MKYLLPVTLLASLLAGPAVSQSATDGEKVFKKCKACHRVGPDAKNSVGPILTSVIGRAAGSVEGYKYSKSMTAAGESGLVWSEESIAEYLVDPTKYLRALLDNPKARAKMSFKLKSEGDRLDVVAYLATFQTAAAKAPSDGFCVVNSSEHLLFFATETREGERNSSNLEPGEQLCSAATTDTDGIVSVYESEDGFEGCSRIIPVGISEEMTEFAEFDRCGWSSHDS